MTATITDIELSTVVLDCRQTAWDLSDQSCFDGYDRDFIALYRPDIDLAACYQIGVLLRDEWARRGYQLTLVSRERFTPDTVTLPSGWVYLDVANAAAAKIDVDVLFDALDLTDTYATWVATR